MQLQQQADRIPRLPMEQGERSQIDKVLQRIHHSRDEAKKVVFLILDDFRYC